MSQLLKSYFEQSHTPEADSPVGRLMTRILQVRPNTPFEEAREHAHTLLDKAAGRFKYRPPTVLTPEQESENRKRLAQLTRTVRKAA